MQNKKKSWNQQGIRRFTMEKKSRRSLKEYKRKGPTEQSSKYLPLSDALQYRTIQRLSEALT